MPMLMSEVAAGNNLQIEQRAATETAEIAHYAGIIAAGNIAGRLLGLGREAVKSHYFGAGGSADALTLALRVPILLYDLFIGGMINSSLVPVFVKYEAGDRRRLWELLSVMATLGAAVFAACSALLMLLAGPIAAVLGGGLPDAVLAQTAALLRLTAPATLLLSLSGIFMGALFALKRFAFPAFAAAALNAGIVAGTLLLHERLGPVSMALGLLVGALLQLALQLRGLRDAPLRWRLDLNHPGIGHVTRLYTPIFLGLLVDVLLSRPLTYRLASLSGTGGIARMEYAQTLSHFPRGLVALGISAAVLPLLAAHAARERAGGSDARAAFRGTLARGVRLTLALIVPASLGLILLAHPVVTLLLEHGSFTAADTWVTTRALQLYALALPLAAIDGLLVYAFFARQDTFTPALIGVGTVLIYLALAFALQPSLGLYSVMVADGLKLVLHLALSAALLARGLGGLGHHGVAGALLRILLASAVMALGIALLLPLLPDGAATPGLPGKVLTVLLPALAGVAVYLAAAAALGLSEVALLRDSVRRGVARRLWP